jgi:hypothetical protein
VKTLRRKFAVAILTLALATGAFAGQIQFPGAASTGTGTTGISPAETDITMIMTAAQIASSLPPY